MGLPESTAAPLLRVFRTTHVVAQQTGALSLALLAAFGLTFVADVQLGYERIWGLPARSLLRLWHVWRRTVYLAALTGYPSFEVDSGVLLQHGPLQSAVRIFIFVTAGLLFFWWGQHFLLAGQVPWIRLLPGAIATVVGLSGLRAFSTLVFNPMIASAPSRRRGRRRAGGGVLAHRRGLRHLRRLAGRTVLLVRAEDRFTGVIAGRRTRHRTRCRRCSRCVDAVDCLRLPSRYELAEEDDHACRDSDDSYYDRADRKPRRGHHPAAPGPGSHAPDAGPDPSGSRPPAADARAEAWAADADTDARTADAQADAWAADAHAEARAAEAVPRAHAARPVPGSLPRSAAGTRAEPGRAVTEAARDIHGRDIHNRDI